MFIINKNIKYVPHPCVSILMFSLLVLTAGCDVGSDYQRPELVTRQHSKFIHQPQQQATEEMSQWWRRMDDPWMDRHVETLLQENLDLRQATARVQQAWYVMDAEAGGKLPSLSAGATGTRAFRPLGPAVNQFGGAPGGGGSSTDRIFFTNYEANLSTAWQLDLFGKIENCVEKAEAIFKASQEERQALRHTLIAELARRRVALAMLQKRLALTREIVKSREHTLKAVNIRYEHGVDRTTASDVLLAEESLQSAKADIPRLQAERTAQALAVDVLLGKQPGWTARRYGELAMVPPPLKAPVGVPAQLLDRRPDVRSAELRTIAATEQVGVAIANLYPDLTLRASIGYQGTEVGQWFGPEQLAGSLLGDLMMRLFEGGSLRAKIDHDKARVKEMAAAYAKTVLQAVKEVEEALNAEVQLTEQREEQQKRVVAIRKAEEAANARYERGRLPLLTLLDVQRRHLAAEMAWLDVLQQSWEARIAQYLALGGDWVEQTKGSGDEATS